MANKSLRSSLLWRMVIAFVLMCCVALSSQLSITTKVDKVDSVLIYGSSLSEVTREVVIKDNLPSGIHAITVTGLSEKLDDRCVEITGAGKAEILDIKIVSSTTTKENDPNYRTLLAQLNAKQEELILSRDGVEKRLSFLETKAKSMQTYIDHAINSTAIKSLDDVMSLLSGHDSFVKEAHAETSELLKNKRMVSTQISLLENKIRSLQSSGVYTDNEGETRIFSSKTEKSITFQFKIDKPTTSPTQLFLSYFISPASWHAEYDIRVGKPVLPTSPSNSNSNSNSYGKYEIEIDYFANVEQHTGEEWEEVSLALSTSSPSHANPAPALSSRGVYFQPPKMAATFASSSSPRMHKFVEPESAFLSGTMESGREFQKMDAVQYVSADVSSSGDLSASYLFEIGYRVNITNIDVYAQQQRQQLLQAPVPFSQPRHRLLIDKVSFPATLFTYAVPSASSHSYLRMWTKLPSEIATSLLESPSARVFIENAYTGTTHFSAVKAGSDIKLNLGENKNIEISSTAVVPLNNKLVEDKSTWFVTDKEKFRVKTEETLFTVKNTHPVPSAVAAATTVAGKGTGSEDVLMVVAEVLPKSSEEEIKVELLSPSTKELHSSVEAANKVLTAELKRITDQQQSVAASGSVSASRIKEHISALTTTTDGTAQEEEYMSALLYTSALLRAADQSQHQQQQQQQQPVYVFKNSATSTVYWVKWLNAGETYTSSYKYRIMWPEKRPSIFIS